MSTLDRRCHRCPDRSCCGTPAWTRVTRWFEPTPLINVLVKTLFTVILTKVYHAEICNNIKSLTKRNFPASYQVYLLIFNRLLGGTVLVKNVIIFDVSLDHLATLSWTCRCRVLRRVRQGWQISSLVELNIKCATPQVSYLLFKAYFATCLFRQLTQLRKQSKYPEGLAYNATMCCNSPCTIYANFFCVGILGKL